MLFLTHTFSVPIEYVSISPYYVSAFTMLTPAFEISQDAATLTITIKAPFAKVTVLNQTFFFRSIGNILSIMGKQTLIWSCGRGVQGVRVCMYDRVPTAQGKQGKWPKQFPLRENTGNLEIVPKHREFGFLKL